MSHDILRYHSVLRSGLLVVALVSSTGLRAEKPLRPGEEVSMYFEASVETDRAIDIPVDGSIELDATVRLSSELQDDRLGLFSYILSIRHDSDVLTLDEISVHETHRDIVSATSFEVIDMIDNESGTGFLVVYQMMSDLCSFPRSGDWACVHARYTTVPRAEEQRVETEIHFGDGLQGEGIPVWNAVYLYYDQQEVHEAEFRDLALSLDFREPRFRRADANFDGVVDVSDPVAILNSLFGELGGIECQDAADANDDGGVDISDSIFSLAFLFLGGRSPPEPFPGEGLDPTPDELGCFES